jgi:hypothetical protein
LDLDNFDRNFREQSEIVYCYGTLYHLSRPAAAIASLAGCCTAMMLLETCVSYGEEAVLNVVAEPTHNPTQALSGVGCRPTRAWVYLELKKHFRHVYFPLTQPFHEQFPTDWSAAASAGLTRAVFIGSRAPLENAMLTETIPMRQGR